MYGAAACLSLAMYHFLILTTPKNRVNTPRPTTLTVQARSRPRADSRTCAMSPFENPSPPYSPSQLRTWFRHVESDMRDPELLWNVYWKRFNTIQISVYNESEYFENAIAAAKLAKGRRKDFERIFEERNGQRWASLLDLMIAATNQARYHEDVFPCEDALHTVLDVCQTGCFADFVRLLKGSAFGWEEDVEQDVPSDDASSDAEEQGSVEEWQASIHGEMQDCETQYFDAFDDCGAQYLDDYDDCETRAEAQPANASFYRGRHGYSQRTAPTSNVMGGPALPRSHTMSQSSDASILKKEDGKKRTQAGQGKRSVHDSAPCSVSQ